VFQDAGSPDRTSIHQLITPKATRQFIGNALRDKNKAWSTYIITSKRLSTDNKTASTESKNTCSDSSSMGNRTKQHEYVIDSGTGLGQRTKTYLEQTGKRRPRKLSRKRQQQIDWRRNKLSEYLVMGKSLMEISSIMGISYHTLYEDQQFLKEQARETMRSHIADLPLNIKQATDGLNKLISMLYDIAAPSSSISSDIARDLKKNSDHVRVMAMSLIKDCMKEKIEILTSQAAVNHALDFVEKTRQQVKEQFDQDMQQVVERDRIESAAINDAVDNNPEIQSYTGESAESLSPEQAPIRSIDQ
jgi:hypothetical protein